MINYLPVLVYFWCLFCSCLTSLSKAFDIFNPCPLTHHVGICLLLIPVSILFPYFWLIGTAVHIQCLYFFVVLKNCIHSNEPIVLKCKVWLLQSKFHQMLKNLFVLVISLSRKWFCLWKYKWKNLFVSYFSIPPKKWCNLWTYRLWIWLIFWCLTVSDAKCYLLVWCYLNDPCEHAENTNCEQSLFFISLLKLLYMNTALKLKIVFI